MKFFVFIFIFTLTFFVFAEDNDHYFDPKTSSMIPKYLGVVKKMKGKVLAEDRELAEGSKVYPSEKIKTSEGSFLIVELVDDTHLSLGPNSEFIMEGWKYRTKNDREGTFKIIRGQIRAFIKSKSKDNDQLKIETKLAAMGVRGTEFLVNESLKDNKNLTQIGLLEGKINLKSDKLNFKKNLIPGDSITLFYDGNEALKMEKNLTKEELDFLNSESEPGVKNFLKYASFDDFKGVDKLVGSLENDTQKKEKSEKKMLEESLKDKLNKLNKIRENNKVRKI